MNNEERIKRLREILKPVIDWYNKIEAEGEPDGSYLYDTTYEMFNDNLTSGNYQEIIEILKSEPVPSEGGE